MLTAPGGDETVLGGMGMVSTDRTAGAGYVAGDYTAIPDNIQGTSFSAPVVSGVAALLLEADPNLTWRDVMHVLIRTATKNDALGSGWANNGAGLHFNHRYGFGLVDANAAVDAVAAGAWRAVPASATPLTGGEGSGGSLSIVIPDNNLTGITRSVTFSSSSRFRAEHVEFSANITHTYRGDLSFELTSPSGYRSLVPGRSGDGGSNIDWTFTSVAHWGETAAGTWRLRIIDAVNLDTGVLNSWSIRVYGYQLPAIPTIASISPPWIETGSGATIITVNGTGFDSTSVVSLDGTALTTTLVSSTQLTAVVPGGLLAVDGVHIITVNTLAFQGQGGGTSTASTLTVSSPVSPVFTVQPADRTVAERRTTSFRAVATGFEAPILQWQRSNDGGTTWNNIVGATASTYTLASVQLTDTGSMYHCIATNTAGTATSNGATLTVTEIKDVGDQKSCALGSGFALIGLLFCFQLMGRRKKAASGW
jgi:subtilisin-like proprotein convertase family protein